jgi:hypothetical protein
MHWLVFIHLKKMHGPKCKRDIENIRHSIERMPRGGFKILELTSSDNICYSIKFCHCIFLQFLRNVLVEIFLQYSITKLGLNGSYEG